MSNTAPAKTTFVSCMIDCHENSTFDTSHYTKKCFRTLMIDAPFVIFCGPKYAKMFRDIRDIFGLGEKTQIIEISLADLKIYRTHKQQITDCYKHTVPNPKGTPEFYSVVLSKFEFLRQVIESNPFNTTHVAWIDINLLLKTFSNSLNYIEDAVFDKLAKIAAEPQDKLTCGILNYWDRSYYADIEAFSKQYQWIVPACFFTCSNEVGAIILPKASVKAVELIERRFCQGEEQVFAFLIDDNPEYFNLYVSDYQDVINNYYSTTSNHGYVNWVISKYIAGISADTGKFARIRRS
jgi:hypothetical protein